MKNINLKGIWQLRHEPLSSSADRFKRISKLKSNWIETPVPGDIRQGLLDEGLIKEPSTGLNSFEDNWVEQRSWWLKKTFIASREMLKSDLVELVLDGLDSNASIFLNNTCIGHHNTTFRPFVAPINEYLTTSENILMIRLTHNLNEIEGYDRTVLDQLFEIASKGVGSDDPHRNEPRRILMRKPQYSWGWDWAPRTASCGITGGAEIRVINKAAIRNIKVSPSKNKRNAKLDITLELEWLDQFKAGKGEVLLTLFDPDNRQISSVRRKQLLQSGLNFIDISIDVKNARLWWPSGLGKQDRYKIKAELFCGRKRLHSKELKYGIRFIKLDTDNTFCISVNGKSIFAKGANWVPADTLYGRVSDDRVRKLVEEARFAGFNMLRVWGGGLYERDAFYEACEENGIAVWHDFMFACAAYPDHIEEFRNEIIREAQYQTQRLQNRCCIVLWCGSNECLMFQMPGRKNETQCGKYIWGHILPKAVRENCPSTPYWHSSPYGTGDNYKCSDSSSVGDCHYWKPAMMNPDMKKRISPEVYDNCQSMFVSEFGYPGPCSLESTLEYLGQPDIDRNSKVWRHHFNYFARKSIEAGIIKHYLAAGPISNDQYLQLGGMVQGLMYGYSLDSLRASENCSGALFWMYNDCWGEIGWSIIDYYLRRKISWYYVKRAFSPRRLILRNRGDKINVVFSNHSNKVFKGTLEYGYVTLDGEYLSKKRIAIHSNPLETSVAVKFSKDNHNSRKGVWFSRFVNDQTIHPGICKAAEPAKLQLKRPQLKWKVKALANDRYSLSIESDVFAHAVVLSLPEAAIFDDNYFDLLPNRPQKIYLRSKQKLSRHNVSAEAAFFTHGLK